MEPEGFYAKMLPVMKKATAGRCMVCAKTAELRGGMCEACQDRIRREALGEQRRVRAEADQNFKRHGVNPEKAK